ncbi:MAG: TIGR03066 family protein [Gemmata sp.]
MRPLVASVAFVILAGFATAADDKIDAKKLVGKWEPAKAEKGAPKMTLEIAEKGKLTLLVALGDKTEKVEGSYKLDGNKLEVELSFGGKSEKETLTITKLTEEELVTKDSKGKEDALKRVKGK